MNNVIMRRIVVTPDFAPLSSGQLIGSVEISASPLNSAAVVFEGDNGDEVEWLPGEYHSFRRVDLSSIRLRGASGDVVTIVGGTW